MYEIRKHPFFADMDWNALVEQKLEAPYTPEIRTDTDAPNQQELDTMVQGDIKSQDAYE